MLMIQIVFGLVVPGRQGNGNNRNPMLPGRHLPGQDFPAN
jgi:hypothetical protein